MQLACAFAEIRDITEHSRVRIIYDPDFSRFKLRIKQMKNEEKLVVHYPSYQNIRRQENKVILNEMSPMLQVIDNL